LPLNIPYLLRDAIATFAHRDSATYFVAIEDVLQTSHTLPTYVLCSIKGLNFGFDLVEHMFS
jgi:hypothetical protein